ncbi:MAG: HlyU family transcriptional regulator [Alphaproteobacteria bacterium]|nr:HlyU family transcriptional regulator [Alphaproteobacteria bacterium]
MSLFSKLFGRNTQKAAAPKSEDPVIHDGYKIIAAPIQEGGQWRLAGTIIKTTPEGDLERLFVRADVFHSRDEAVEYTISKGQQVIDQMGERIFEDGKPTGRA